MPTSKKSRKLSQLKKSSIDSSNAICVLHKNNSKITGVIKFINLKNKVKIEYEIYNLKDGKHGFHIHEYGDLTDGCNTACSHFNPDHKTHGSNDSDHRHVGDLGNIESKNRVSRGTIYNSSISLDVSSKYSIIGRSVIVHDKEDDLGFGGDDESLKTGNAGKRLACGVIGLSKFKC